MVPLCSGTDVKIKIKRKKKIVFFFVSLSKSRRWIVMALIYRMGNSIQCGHLAMTSKASGRKADCRIEIILLFTCTFCLWSSNGAPIHMNRRERNVEWNTQRTDNDHFRSFIKRKIEIHRNAVPITLIHFHSFSLHRKHRVSRWEWHRQ